MSLCQIQSWEIRCDDCEALLPERLENHPLRQAKANELCQVWGWDTRGADHLCPACIAIRDGLPTGTARIAN